MLQSPVLPLTVLSDRVFPVRDLLSFLHRALDGSEESTGTLFVAVNWREENNNTIIYGHNMKDGTAFGSLAKFADPSFGRTHNIIHFDTLYEDGQYAVFAVLEIDTTPGAARWYDLWSLNSGSYAEREEAIRTMERRSVISSSLDVQADDQILLLVTCVGDDDERLVVAAVRIKE